MHNADTSDSAAKLVHLSHPPSLRELWECGDSRPTFDNSLYMVIRAYIDESYAEPRTFALGCALARGMDWFEISSQWKHVLDRKNAELRKAGRPMLTRFHATDFNSYRGEFEGWQSEERTEFLRDLIAVIRKSRRVHILGCTIDLRDIVENFPVFLGKPNANHEYHLVAYGILTIVLWRKISAEARKVTSDPTVIVVYDRNPFNGILDWSYNAFRDSTFPDRLLFTGALIRDEPIRPPLQIADLVAYESMKEIDRAEAGRARRLSLGALLTSVRHGEGVHVNRNKLRKLTEGYWSELLPNLLAEAGQDPV